MSKSCVELDILGELALEAEEQESQPYTQPAAVLRRAACTLWGLQVSLPENECGIVSPTTPLQCSSMDEEKIPSSSLDPNHLLQAGVPTLGS